ncbi:MAG TPA: response regulator [Flavobacterium sp.]|jgi:CheY-like chemotaxis protein|uniref:response regulator n=1 Tax=Flavobacterium sp. TaxID=239 RepID=UPI001B6FB27F|nr:response regulator [Flavobacterium sp.]MBP6145742.1 response regulator [Flavobacterium sp.]MBP7181978.1 response regulator [Flavobacterium sp.]MBP7317863.1 response regulator [Flavobacterium sp.]MBP8886196.1 response regulator [Flavobacterium sp.]HRM12235.1 response regulator [Flavobacterium sp.]
MLDQILCVDDDPITLMLCKKVIIKSSFSNEIITSQNGEEALSYFNSIKYANNKNKLIPQPQLIFLDLNMPIMGGWEFLDCFNSEEFSEFNNIKVVVLSSTIDPDDFEKSKQYPMVIDFFSKPISQAMLEHLKNKLKLKDLT